MEVRDVAMDFQYGEAFTESSPEAYERLLLDVLLGDATLFPRNAEVEADLARSSTRSRSTGPSTTTGPAVPGRRVGPAGRRRDARSRGPRLAATVTTPAVPARDGRRHDVITLWDTTGSEVVKALAAERRSAGAVASAASR